MNHSLTLLPRYHGPSSWWEHVPIAHWLVAEIKPKVIVELGTHYGVSFFSFCEAAECFSDETFVYAIDTWQGDPQAGFYGDAVYQVVSEHQQAFHQRRSRLVRSTFEEAAEHFAPQSVDIVHVDGLHTYEAVKQDFETWLPKLKPNGSILFHDWNVREGDFGVWRFWDELRQDGRFHCLEVPNGHGLAIATLSILKPDWHQAFSEWSSALTAKGALLGQLASLKGQSSQTNQDLITASQHAKNLEAILVAKTQEIEGLTKRQEELVVHINSLDMELMRIKRSKTYRFTKRLLGLFR